MQNRFTDANRLYYLSEYAVVVVLSMRIGSEAVRDVSDASLASIEVSRARDWTRCRDDVPFGVVRHPFWFARLIKGIRPSRQSHDWFCKKLGRVVGCKRCERTVHDHAGHELTSKGVAGPAGTNNLARGKVHGTQQQLSEHRVVARVGDFLQFTTRGSYKEGACCCLVQCGSRVLP